MDSPIASLEELRRRIDALDDRLHDLVMDRAELVAGVAALKRSSGVPALRSGREAQILRRLVARHRGPLPRPSLVRLWRELLGGMVAIQGRFEVAVLVPPGRPSLWDMARDHFGGHLAMTQAGAPAAIWDAVATGRAAAGVLPLPREDEAAPWWPALLIDEGVHVVARLPFAGRGNARDAAEEALVIGRSALDPSGQDGSLLAIVTTGEPRRDPLLAALAPLTSRISCLGAVASAPGEAAYLFDFAESILPTDPRLVAALKPFGAAVRQVRLVGLYARPLPSESR
ncbi:MAG: chorismate mutase [Stellaceae bacterium]